MRDAEEKNVPDCAYVENRTPAEIRRTLIGNASGTVIDNDVVNLEVRNEPVNAISMDSEESVNISQYNIVRNYRTVKVKHVC